MKCIYCKSEPTKVTNSRSGKSQSKVWRRRLCDVCQRTFTTYEIPEMSQISVISGQDKQKFSKSKLIISIYKSFSHDQNTGSKYSLDIADTVCQKILKEQTDGAIDIETLRQIIYSTLRNFDAISGMQYGAQKGIIKNVKKKPGRPSFK